MVEDRAICSACARFVALDEDDAEGECMVPRPLSVPPEQRPRPGRGWPVAGSMCACGCPCFVPYVYEVCR